MTSSRMVRIVIAADVASAIRGFQQVETGMAGIAATSKTASASTSTFGDSLKKGLASVGMVTGIAAVGAAIMGTLRVGMQFEDALNTLKAVTGGTAEEMTRAAATARALGADITLPAVSAGDAADAMLELSKGGLTLQESMDAARGTLLLAAAANITGGEAAKFQAAAIKTFNLEASDAGRVADVLANTANSAAGEITDFGAGLQQAGTVANAFGWSIEETTTMLGLMANAGIRGSDAGTSLKTALTQLLTPTTKQSAALADLGVQLRNSDGQMISARDLSGQLAAARERMSAAEFASAAATAFGTDAVRTALVASQAGAEGYDKLAESVGRAGGAQAVAEARTQGLSGAFSKFSSVVQDLALAFYEKLSPALQGVVNFATTVVGALGDLVGWIGQLPAPILATAAALGGWLILRGPLTALFTAIELGIGRVVLGANALAVGGLAKIGPLLLRAFGGPIGLAITALTLGFTLFQAAGNDTQEVVDDINAKMDELKGTLDSTTGAVTQATKATLAKQLADDGLLSKMKELGVSTDTFVAAATNEAGAMDALKSNVAAATGALLEHSDAYQTVKGALSDAGISQGAFSVALREGGSSLDDLRAKVQAHAEELGREAGNQQVTNDTMLAFEAAVAQTGPGLQQLNGFMLLAGDTADRLGVEVDKAALVQEAMGLAADAAGISVEELAHAAEGAGPSIEGMKDATDAMGTAAQYADSMTNFLIATINELNHGSVSAEESQRRMAAAMREIGGSARDLAAAQDELTTKQAELTELQGSGEATALQLADASRAVEEAADGVKDAEDRQFEAHVKVRDAAVEQAAKAYALAAANGDLDGASLALNDTLAYQKSAFIQAQIAAGMEETAAITLADQLFAIPADVLTRIKEQGAAEAQAAAVEVKAAVEAIPTQWNTTLSVVDNLTQAAIRAGAAIAAIPLFRSTQLTNTTTNVVETINRGAAVPVAEEGGHISFANAGQLINGRGISQRRKGKGPGVTWAEGITGDEWYISGKNGQEAKSRALIQDAAQEFGGYADFPGAGMGAMPQGSSAGTIGGKIIIQLNGDGITDQMIQTASVVSDAKLGSVAVELRRAGDQW